MRYFISDLREKSDLLDLRRQMDIHEEMNQLTNSLVGYREATFQQMMQTVETLKVSNAILRTSQNEIARRKDVKEA